MILSTPTTSFIVGVVVTCCAFMFTTTTTITTVSGFISPSPCSPNQNFITSTTSNSILLQAVSSDNSSEEIADDNVDDEPTFLSSRRDTFTRTATATAAVLAATMTTSQPEPALAAADAPAAAAATTLKTKQQILNKLSGVPTFALVNEDGIPFIIFDRSTGSGTGYFFLTRDYANQALESARKSDPSKGADEIWGKAKVKVVPMSIALQLALGKRRRTTINEEKGVEGIQVDTIHLLIPSDAGNKDATRLDTQRNNNAKKWEQKGRVPLFHIKEKKNGQHSYYSFETNQLIADYKTRNNDPSLLDFPPIEIDQLIYSINKAATTPGGKEGDWSSLSDFANTIQPTKESRQDAIELLTQEQKSSTGITQYNLDKAYLVGAAKN